MLIELSGTSTDKPREKQKRLIGALKKLFQWLRAMKGNNAMADKAYGIAFRMMKRVAVFNSDLVRCFSFLCLYHGQDMLEFLGSNLPYVILLRIPAAN